jgi:hypothetical protein
LLPGCLLGSSVAVAAFIRKRVGILLNDGRRNFLEIQNIKCATYSQHPNQLLYSNVLVQILHSNEGNFSGIKYLFTISGLIAICLKNFATCIPQQFQPNLISYSILNL